MGNTQHIQIHQSEHRVMAGARELGAAGPEEEVQVLLQLRYPPSSPPLHSHEELAAQHPNERQHLSREEFKARYSAEPEDVEKVRAFAREYSLEVLAVQPVHRVVILLGTVASMSKAFNAELKHYEHPSVGQYRGLAGHISVPEDIHSIVRAVFGLDNRPVVHAREPSLESDVQEGSPAGGNGDDEAVEKPFFPNEVAQIYDFPSDVTGEGQSIAVIELGGGYNRTVLQEYFEKYIKVPMPDIKDVLVGGAKNNPASLSSGEVYLDIQVLGAIAPGAQLVVYFSGSSYADFLQVVNNAIHDDEHDNSVISISWGGPEPLENEMYTSAMNDAFKEAANLGITVCASSGDDGASDERSNPDGQAHVNFPASSPYALCCGGTKLIADGANIRSEVAWNEAGKATGGGVSTVFPCPDYQQRAGICPASVNPNGGTGRGVPDVAGNAAHSTGYKVLQSGVPWPVASGGTSAVAPLWAALIALINQKLGKRVGFINPFLYQTGGVFNDITEGNNTTSQAPGYDAGPGWDPCTGWGSPNGQKLLAALQQSS